MVAAFLPLVSFTLLASLAVPNDWPRWLHMAVLAVGIFAGCKWLTWWSCDRKPGTVARHAAYLFAWPGMNAHAFFDRSKAVVRPTCIEWLFAVSKMALGGVLLVSVAWFTEYDRYWVGWLAMVGIVLSLHFGLFHLLSCLWRCLGIDAAPLMNAPILSTSVMDFWGRRWNTAFRDLTHRFVFRPLTRTLPAHGALASGFLLSGLVHDLVISLPARGGFGGPTVFFLIQALAAFIERSDLGTRLGLGKGVRGWAFTLAVLVVPAPLLFHRAFVVDVVLPMVESWGELPWHLPI